MLALERPVGAVAGGGDEADEAVKVGDVVSVSLDGCFGLLVLCQ